LLKTANLTPIEWCAVTSGICDLHLDPLSIARVIIYLDGNVTVLSISEVFDLVRTRGLAIFKSAHMEHVESYHDQTVYQAYPTFRPIRNSSFLSLSDEASEGGFDFIGCLKRHAKIVGHQIHFEERKNASRSHFGMMHVLLLTAIPISSSSA
jgi:hypothetical protein